MKYRRKRSWLYSSWTMSNSGNRGLYIHVPFCVRKCPYCDFYSLPGETALYSGYAQAVKRNLSYYSERFDTVDFGGGTPNLIAPYMAEILSAADIAPGAEITAECNPASATAETLAQMRNAGINRLSVGVQSLHDAELQKLGRLHNAAEAEALILGAEKAGFSSISADVMLGVPGQTAESLSDTLQRLGELPIQHISAYMLTIEPATPFGKNPPSGMADDEKMADLYALCQKLCEELGFHQYEISNFAREGFQCRHNLKYWRDEEYLGIGPAAHSFYEEKRFAVPKDLPGFINAPRQTTEITDDSPGDYDERVMMGLRLAEGIPEELYMPLLPGLKLLPPEYWALENGRLRLTSAGFPVYNYIVSLLLAHTE